MDDVPRPQNGPPEGLAPAAFKGKRTYHALRCHAYRLEKFQNPSYYCAE